MKQRYKNLSEFIQCIDAAGELKVIDQPVSHYLEISKLTDRESKSPNGGKALYFKNVKGSPFPAATNLFGSQKRICMALGVNDLDQLGSRIREIVDISTPSNFKDVLSLMSKGLSVSNFFPRRSRAKNPPCQEVVRIGEDVDLNQLPILHCWPKDAGRFITLPLVFTRSLVSGKRNVGMYRLQVFDKKTTGMHWHIHKDGSHYYNEYCQAGKRMPVAVTIGSDPATIYAATAPMPRNVDELILAGFIRNRPVSLTRCKTIDLEVPTEAEFVLEGYVNPGELRREGPFGDHTGYYSLADDYPVFHVTAITHRKSPIYCATLVGRPPMEDCYLAKATERLFLPLLQTAFPEICDYWLPWEGVFHNIVVVSINKEFPGHAHKIMHGLWGQGQMSFCKAIAIVDNNVDLKHSQDIIHRLLENLDVGTDLTLTKGALDVLDHSSPIPNFGSKIGVDLTDRFSGEPQRLPSLSMQAVRPADIEGRLATIQQQVEGIQNIRCFPDPEKTDRFNRVRNRILLLTVDRGDDKPIQYYVDTLLKKSELKIFNMMILYDRAIDLQDNSLLLWKIFNNVDPQRDLHQQDGRLVIDACKKGPADGHTREWPEELTFDEI